MASAFCGCTLEDPCFGRSEMEVVGELCSGVVISFHAVGDGYVAVTISIEVLRNLASTYTLEGCYQLFRLGLGVGNV